MRTFNLQNVIAQCKWLFNSVVVKTELTWCVFLKPTGILLDLLQALYIHPDEPYSLHWPMKGGHLNLHSGPGGSLTAVCADLEALWAYAIQTCLTIPLRDLGVSVCTLILIA